jgi:hypothetical protein
MKKLKKYLIWTKIKKFFLKVVNKQNQTQSYLNITLTASTLLSWLFLGGAQNFDSSR